MKPIIFNTEMVRAILDGRKTQTRRPVKPQPRWVACPNVPFKTDDADPKGIINSPYQVGDVLYVRETYFFTRFDSEELQVKSSVRYKADGNYCPRRDCVGRSWKPSIHMPKWASRIFLRVTNVRIERIKDISEADAMAEGVNWMDNAGLSRFTAKKLFITLWGSIHGEQSWDENPWVWVYDFEVISKEEAHS